MFELIHGDCVKAMSLMPANSIDAVITSPPYAMQRAATYGGIPAADYPAWSVEWMTEARRVLKPNGSAVINIRPNVRNGQISDYVLRTRLALRADGWAEIDELIWHKTGVAPMGHVGRPRRSWESLLWFALHGRPFCDPKANGSASDRVGGLQGGQRSGAHIHGHQNDERVGAGIARQTDVITLSVGANGKDDNAKHPAQYPPALAEWIAKLICPPGGTILDPFSGSASTGVGALRNGFNYIGIDSVDEYVDMARRRLDALAA